MLGRIRSVVYLQSDPGMYRICDFLHTLTVRKTQADFIRAPEPLAVSRVGMRTQGKLDRAYREFVEQDGKGSYFYRHDGRERGAGSITSFLCTKRALELFSEAAGVFDRMSPRYPGHRPCCDDDSDESVAAKLDNAGALKEARQFVGYATVKGHRGTPHR